MQYNKIVAVSFWRICCYLVSYLESNFKTRMFFYRFEKRRCKGIKNHKIALKICLIYKSVFQNIFLWNTFLIKNRSYESNFQTKFSCSSVIVTHKQTHQGIQSKTWWQFKCNQPTKTCNKLRKHKAKSKFMTHFTSKWFREN